MENKCYELKSNTPFVQWYFGLKQYRKYAVICKTLIDKIGGLKPVESRIHSTGDYVCWYFCLNDDYEERVCIILRPEIREDDICFQFQSANDVPKELLKCGEKAKPHTKWLHLLYSNYGEAELQEIITKYLSNIRKNWAVVEKNCKRRRPCQYQRRN